MNNSLKIVNVHKKQMSHMMNLMEKHVQKKIIPELTLEEVYKFHEDKAK